MVHSSIGLASATSQLDRNAWQHVATYKSGSKQTWRRIFFVWNHIEKAQTDRTPAQLPLCWAATARFFLSSFQVQIPCFILRSCDMSQVRWAVSLSVVPVQRCCLEEDPSRPSLSFPWAVLCVVDFLSLILVGHSTEKTHETMKRRQVLHTSTSNDFHAALFVDDFLARRSTSARSETAPYSTHANLAQPPLSVQLWVSKLSKSYQNFWNLLLKEK